MHQTVISQVMMLGCVRKHEYDLHERMENVEMDSGYKEDREDQERIINSWSKREKMWEVTLRRVGHVD